MPLHLSKTLLMLRSLLPLLVLVLLEAPHGNSQQHTADCLALVKFFNSTSKRPWKNSTGWKTWNSTTPDCCKWHGVTCNGGSPRRVTRLNLTDNGLSGTIPASVGQLKRLEVWEMPDNMIYGQIPNEMMDLWTDFRCGNENGVPCNPFTGSGRSAPECGGQLCYAYGGLKRINMKRNRLSGSIPKEISKLFRTMEHLDLSSNRLTGTLPTNLGYLHWVTTLDLYFNRIKGPVPPSIGRMVSLRFLSLAFNQLSGPIPVELGNLQRLEQIDLSANRFTGPVPSKLGVLVDPAPPMYDRPGSERFGETLRMGDLSKPGSNCEPNSYTMWFVSGVKQPCTSGFGSSEFWCDSCDPPFPSVENPRECYSDGMAAIPPTQLDPQGIFQGVSGTPWVYQQYPIDPWAPTITLQVGAKGPNLRLRVVPKCTREQSMYTDPSTWVDFTGLSMGVGKRRAGGGEGGAGGRLTEGIRSADRATNTTNQNQKVAAGGEAKTSAQGDDAKREL